MFGTKRADVFAPGTWTENVAGLYASVSLSASSSGGSHWVDFNGFYWYESFQNNGFLQDIEQTDVGDFTCGQICLSYLLLFGENEALAKLL